MTAVEALVAAEGREARGLLRSRFPLEKDTKVKRAIALALGKLADADAVDLLVAALRDAHTPVLVRDGALEAIELIGSKKADRALAGMLAQATSRRTAAARDRGPGTLARRRGDPAAFDGPGQHDAGRAPARSKRWPWLHAMQAQRRKAR